MNENGDSCDLCRITRKGTECNAKKPDAEVPESFWYECSRPVGHAGDHAACGGAEAHPIVSWTKEVAKS
jgi:hypothetical protein